MAVDASYCPVTKIAAWAAAICGKQVTILRGGLVKDKCGNSNSAEVHALVLGLNLAIEIGAVSHGERITIFADNRSVGDLVLNKISARRHLKMATKITTWNGIPGKDTPPGTKPPNSTFMLYKKLVESTKIDVDFQLVYKRRGPPHFGHYSRSLMRHADKLAKLIMKRERISQLAYSFGNPPWRLVAISNLDSAIASAQLKMINGHVAQPGTEHRASNAIVAGSNPAVVSK